MLDGSETKDIKEKLSAIKQLFLTRHLHQCIRAVSECLTRSNGQIHPIHHAYLNFYRALSHDTLAREAVLRNRRDQLELAEEYFLATIADLVEAGAEKLENNEDFQSPTSSMGHSDMMHRRASDAASQNSDHSTSTAASSMLEEEAIYQSTSKEPVSPNSIGYEDDATTHFKTLQRRLSPINTFSTRPTTCQSEQAIAADLFSFKNMVESHLAGVRQLKDTPPTLGHQYSFSRSRSSTPVSRPASRDSTSDDSAKEQLKWQRKKMSFRPRFDPTSVQQLCAEALSEL